MNDQRILVTGVLGQIGTELTDDLRMRFGESNVLATSRRSVPPESYTGRFVQLDVTDAAAIGDVVAKIQMFRPRGHGAADDLHARLHQSNTRPHVHRAFQA